VLQLNVSCICISHMGGVFVGVIAYAVVSASVVQLQRMLSICYSQEEIADIQFNAKNHA